MKLLLELVEKTEAQDFMKLKPAMPAIKKIALMLFKKEPGPVKDPKRSKDPIFWGIAHSKSVFKNAKGDHIKLTFDNSTDSGEFEINSLAPLKIEKGGEVDIAIRSMYRDLKIDSSKKTNYIAVGDNFYLREIHLGQLPDKKAIMLVKGVMKLLKTDDMEDEEEKPAPKEEKPAPKEEKPAPKKVAPKEEKLKEALKDKTKKSSFSYFFEGSVLGSGLSKEGRQASVNASDNEYIAQRQKADSLVGKVVLFNGQSAKVARRVGNSKIEIELESGKKVTLRPDEVNQK